MGGTNFLSFVSICVTYCQKYSVWWWLKSWIEMLVYESEFNWS